jgi:diguanylate cyclase (GGDEF)-like protein
VDRGIVIVRAALAALLLAFAGTAKAADAPRTCFASAAAPAWTCDPATLSHRPEWIAASFDLPAGSPAPRTLATRTTRFSTAALTVIGRDGSRASRTLTDRDMTPSGAGWTMVTALPRIAAPVERVEFTVRRPRHVNILGEARLESAAPTPPVPTAFELTMAALCGLLAAPLLFNIAFYRVLRERFLVWHTGAVFFMLAQTLLTTGLINRIAGLSVFWLCTISATTFAAGVACAALFSRDLIEPGRLTALQRRLLGLTAPWLAAVTAFYLIAGGPLRWLSVPVYFLGFAPVLALFAWTMATAWARGSRSVKFQVAAWAPLMLVGAARIASALGASRVPYEFETAQHFAILAEVVVTALAVVDRFMILRGQRDQALFESRLLGEVADRDPLTGLLNRRALEARFAALYADGFRTVAVVDLDRFKDINDRFGHAAGDRVLRAAALALAPDEDTHAIRIGGEEFVLLLRGADAAARAEQRRNAIPLRIAAEVTGLDRVVTASMGLVEQAGRVLADFNALYAHCDRLLYEAKRAGRNRSVNERIHGFVDRRGEDRRVAA